MALVYSTIARGSAGNQRYVILDVAFDTSYPNTATRATSGEPLTPADMGFDIIKTLLCEQRAGYVFDYDYTNRRLHAFRRSGISAISHTNAAVDAHAVTAQPDAHGTQAHDITTVAAAGGGDPLTEAIAAGGPLEGDAAGQVNANAVAATAATLAHTGLAMTAAHNFTQADQHAANVEGALAEVANATDLSTALAQVRIVVFGV